MPAIGIDASVLFRLISSESGESKQEPLMTDKVGGWFDAEVDYLNGQLKWAPRFSG